MIYAMYGGSQVWGFILQLHELLTLDKYGETIGRYQGCPPELDGVHSVANDAPWDNFTVPPFARFRRFHGHLSRLIASEKANRASAARPWNEARLPLHVVPTPRAEPRLAGILRSPRHPAK